MIVETVPAEVVQVVVVDVPGVGVRRQDVRFQSLLSRSPAISLSENGVGPFTRAVVRRDRLRSYVVLLPGRTRSTASKDPVSRSIETHRHRQAVAGQAGAARRGRDLRPRVVV